MLLTKCFAPWIGCEVHIIIFWCLDHCLLQTQTWEQKKLTCRNKNHRNILVTNIYYPTGLPFWKMSVHIKNFRGAIKKINNSLTQWSNYCQSNCLHVTVSLPCLTTSTESPDTQGEANIPAENEELAEVFSKATQLPPHHSWDCAIELLPNTVPHWI